MKKVGLTRSIHLKFVLIYVLLILLAMQIIGVYFVRALEEKLVDNKAHARVARHLPVCTHETVEGAMHEILMETDAKRAEFWTGFDMLLDRAKV